MWVKDSPFLGLQGRRERPTRAERPDFISISARCGNIVSRYLTGSGTTPLWHEGGLPKCAWAQIGWPPEIFGGKSPGTRRPYLTRNTNKTVIISADCLHRSSASSAPVRFDYRNTIYFLLVGRQNTTDGLYQIENFVSDALPSTVVVHLYNTESRPISFLIMREELEPESEFIYERTRI